MGTGKAVGKSVGVSRSLNAAHHKTICLILSLFLIHTHDIPLKIAVLVLMPYIMILFHFNGQCLVFLLGQESWLHFFFFFFHLDGNFLILRFKHTLILRLLPSQKLTAWLWSHRSAYCTHLTLGKAKFGQGLQAGRKWNPAVEVAQLCRHSACLSEEWRSSWVLHRPKAVHRNRCGTETWLWKGMVLELKGI